MIYAVSSRLYVGESWMSQQQNLHMKHLPGLLSRVARWLISRPCVHQLPDEVQGQRRSPGNI